MKEVLSAYNDFLNTKERCFMLSFVFVFFVYSFNVLPSDALFLIAIGIFILSSARASMLMFMFFSLWENVAIFSFGGTLNFVLQLILLVKILFLPHSIWRDVSRNRLFTLSLLFTVFLWIYGTFDVLFNSFTGIGLAIKMTFGLYVLCFYQDMKTSSCFWKAVLFTIMISSFLSANYGFFHESAVERWISGMGERIGQLYGTLGTTRLGMFLVVSMIYPLYYIKNNIVKSIVLVALLVLVAKTVSVTSFILVFVLFSIYAFSLRGKKNLLVLGLLLSLMIFVSVSYFTIFNPIAYRIEYSVDSFRDGDMSAATSNRSNLADTYWEEYSQNSIVEVVLGTFKLHNKIKNISYAHNSYIGFFFYFGFIGMAFFLYVILKRILYLKGRDCFYPSLLTKVILLIAGLTVSMETTSFWNSFLFL